MVHLNRINVIGPTGIQLQMKVSDTNTVRTPDGKSKTQVVQDQAANLLIEAAFAKWGQKEFCTVHGKYTWMDVQNLTVTHFRTDGEAILRKIWAPRGNPFGFALQIIDPALLDEKWERAASPGQNQIRLGIEMDEYDKPVAYWFKTRTIYTDIYERERVPASEIIHIFDPLRASFTRGIPPLAAVMMDTKMLDAYEEAEVTAARLGASKAGFIITPTGDEYDPNGGADTTGVGGRTMEIEPGVLEELQAGQKFEAYDPQHPTTAFPSFTKAIKQKISVGLNLSYHSVTGDLEGVNYSSIRAGLVEDRESFKQAQEKLKSDFCIPVFAAWLQGALLTQALPLPAAKYDRFNAPVWHGRRWQWVDPLKDVQATMLALKSGLTTHSQELAEEGQDLEEVWQELAMESELAKSLGLHLATFAAAVPVTQEVSTDMEDANGAPTQPGA